MSSFHQTPEPGHALQGANSSVSGSKDPQRVFEMHVFEFLTNLEHRSAAEALQSIPVHAPALEAGERR